MFPAPHLIPPSAQFWSLSAQHLLGALRSEAVPLRQSACDFSGTRVLVPTLEHARLLRLALGHCIGAAFVPPAITTLSGWLALQRPLPVAASGESERLMALYAELRQHAWLKKLFQARRNTDLLPLANTLLHLSDELTQSLLPGIRGAPATLDARWQAALEHLSPKARTLLSEESQLVWTIWKTQLDGRDASAARFERLMILAGQADQPLVWIAPAAPEPFEQAFLMRYSQRQTVTRVLLDWRAAALPPACVAAWPELAEDMAAPGNALSLSHLSVYPAVSLEDEAVVGARTVLDWIAAGKSTIAIIAQDRVVARRMRALLERAQVFVADETGWKLSTTRAASSLTALLELVTSRADTAALLNYLKSSFVLAGSESRSVHVMAIELALRRANVSGGWEAVASALQDLPAERKLFAELREQAGQFQRNRSLCEWVRATLAVLVALGMQPALAADAAGEQLLTLLDRIDADCGVLEQIFSFAEWRSFLNLQLEAAPFVAPQIDRRVLMLSLNGARLRSFDAVVMVGCDASHLPSQPVETLFFANAVRRELGLATRESRQRQQLRDVTELLTGSAEVVLSWQTSRDGEPNPVSAWIERLQLTLARSSLPPIRTVHCPVCTRTLQPRIARMPAPAAPQLRPAQLSASGYNTLMACPYQFFATRMLGLAALDDISDLPEKRDYGGWLHQILATYHAIVARDATPLPQRATLLADLSAQIFQRELHRNAAALGYYVRWQKVMPAYLDWANQREAEGWQFVIGEVALERMLEWPGGSIRLHGRIDRIDQNQQGERAVIDYKTTTQPVLVTRLKRAEDQQLPFYGLLSEPRPHSAHYVALELARDKIGDVAALDYKNWTDALARRIAGQMQAIGDGAHLPANGIESACRFCDMRGLCRKGAW